MAKAYSSVLEYTVPVRFSVWYTTRLGSHTRAGPGVVAMIDLHIAAAVA